MDPEYLARINQIHQLLGIPCNYAAQRGLKLHREAPLEDLQTVSLTSMGTEIRLLRAAAAAWKTLQAAAVAEQIILLPLSGYRSVARQEEIIRQKSAAGQSLSSILYQVAAPGYSEHHTGRALDLSVPNEPPLEESFAETPAFGWLKEQGGQFGFSLSYPLKNSYGIAYEPWHWFWSA